MVYVLLYSIAFCHVIRWSYNSICLQILYNEILRPRQEMRSRLLLKARGKMHNILRKRNIELAKVCCVFLALVIFQFIIK